MPINNTNWNTGILLSSKMVAEDIKSLRFSVPMWTKHKAGQHCDIRLTAPNGYQAQRSYSIANPPEDTGVVEFGIQILENGEVSPYLFQLEVGGQIEIKGPLGGHFIWDVTVPGPLILLGGGSGAVPLISMLRHYVLHRNADPMREIVVWISARRLQKIPYKDELDQYAKLYPNIHVNYTITDEPPTGWTGFTGRINKEFLEQTVGGLKTLMPMTYSCGPTPFVEAVTKILVEIGFNPHGIKTERFGG